MTATPGPQGAAPTGGGGATPAAAGVTRDSSHWIGYMDTGNPVADDANVVEGPSVKATENGYVYQWKDSTGAVKWEEVLVAGDNLPSP